jgi:hypothetical protein
MRGGGGRLCIYVKANCGFISGKLKDLARFTTELKKKVINLWHKDDFGMDSECHFYVVSHSKGAWNWHN